MVNDATATEINTSIIDTFNLQTATHNIPEFNGTNKPLKEFIRIIEQGDELVPETLKSYYVKFVKSRLCGLASDCLIGKRTDTLRDLIKILLDHFAPGKSYSSYIKEIQALRIRKDETVSNFYTRLLSLIDLAKAALKTKYGNNSNVLEPQLDDIALAAFKDGLSDKMSYALTILDNLDTLEKAYTKAKCIENAQKISSNDPLLPPSCSNNSQIFTVKQLYNGSNQSDYKNTQNSNFRPRSRSPSPNRFDHNTPKSIMKPTGNQHPYYYNNYAFPPQPFYPPYNPYCMYPYNAFPPPNQPFGYYPHFPPQNYYPHTSQNYYSHPNWNKDIHTENQTNVHSQNNEHLNYNATSQMDASRSSTSNQRPNQIKFQETEQNHARK